MKKVLRVVKFLTVLLFLITLLSVYAFLPDEVSFQMYDITASKQSFFYYTLIFFCLLNFLLSSLSWFYKRIEEPNYKKRLLKEWVISLPIPVNAYATFVIAYIGIINNAESVNPDSYAYLLYLGPLLVIGWGVALLKILFRPGKPNKDTENITVQSH